MAENTTRFEGEEITLGDKLYIVPALSLRQIRDLGPQLDILDGEITSRPSSEQIMAVVTVLHAAISRNYPEMSADDVLDLMDTGNMTDLVKAAMRTSGLPKREGLGKARPGGPPSP